MKFKHVFVLSMALLLLQATKGSSQSSTDFEQYNEHELIFEQHYRDSSPEEIWNDYLYLQLEIGRDARSLIGSVRNLKEPYFSWAQREIMNLDIVDFTEDEISFIIADDFPSSFRDKIFSYFMNSRSTHSFINEEVSRLVNFAILLNVANSNTAVYRQAIVSSVLNESVVSNSQMISLLGKGTPEQDVELAKRVLYGNPSLSDIGAISGSKIDTYSELARLMYSERAGRKEYTEYNESWSSYYRRYFLRGRMIK